MFGSRALTSARFGTAQEADRKPRPRRRGRACRVDLRTRTIHRRSPSPRVGSAATRPRSPEPTQSCGNQPVGGVQRASSRRSQGINATPETAPRRGDVQSSVAMKRVGDIPWRESPHLEYSCLPDIARGQVWFRRVDVRHLPLRGGLWAGGVRCGTGGSGGGGLQVMWSRWNSR